MFFDLETEISNWSQFLESYSESCGIDHCLDSIEKEVYNFVNYRENDQPLPSAIIEKRVDEILSIVKQKANY